MISSLDFIVVAVFALALAVEVKRGFGKAVFDFAALLVAVRAAPMLAGALSGWIRAAPTPANEAVLYAVSFAIIGGVLVFLGKLLYDATLVSAETFDPLLGGFCGVAMAIILCHVLMRTVALAAGPESVPQVIRDSAMGTEFLTFESYHRLVNVLYSFNREV